MAVISVSLFLELVPYLQVCPAGLGNKKGRPRWGRPRKAVDLRWYQRIHPFARGTAAASATTRELSARPDVNAPAGFAGCSCSSWILMGVIRMALNLPEGNLQRSLKH
jgi:hypothetical protein